MANYIQLLVSVTLVFVCICLIHSTNATTVQPTGTGNSKISKNGTCIVDSDCNGHGRCLLNATGCECDRGWATLDTRANKTTYCTYQLRSKKTAFFISLFFGGFGIDWFYLSRSTLRYIFAGILKLVISCGCCAAWPLIYYTPKFLSSESTKKKFRGISICFTLIAFTWWIIDWARILNNRFPDGQEVGLIPW